jgi:hypothetical protein
MVGRRAKSYEGEKNIWTSVWVTESMSQLYLSFSAILIISIMLCRPTTST